MGAMRTFGLLFFMTILIGGCVAAVSATPPDPPPVAQTPQEVSWERALALIYGGQVATVAQTPHLRVYLTLKDGSRLVTLEPEIDAVYHALLACGVACDGAQMAYEIAYQ